MNEILYSNLSSKDPLISDYCHFVSGQGQYDQLTEFLSDMGFSNFQIRPDIPENCPSEWNIDNCDCRISRECNGVFYTVGPNDPVIGCDTDVCLPEEPQDGCHYLCSPDEYDNYFLTLIKSQNCPGCVSSGPCLEPYKLVYNSCS
jgi:hypothetical protein